MIFNGSIERSDGASRASKKGLTCTDKTIPGNVFSGDHRFEEKAVLGALRNPKVCHAWCDEICRELHKDRNAISALFTNDELLDGRERWVGLELLQRVRWMDYIGEAAHLWIHR